MTADNSGDSVTISEDEYHELLRMRLAVDTATQPFMMIRPDWTINYLNEPMKRLLQERARDISAGGGVPSAGVGDRLDRLFPQLQAERKVMDASREEGIDREYTIGEAVLKVHVTGEDSEDGEFLGNTLEWFDLTTQREREKQQQDAEAQVEQLIQEVLDGRLDDRIDTSDMEGFIQQLGENLNRLIDSVQEPVDESIRAVQALAEGDLTIRMQGDYKGQFGRMQEAINGSMEHLDNLVGQILEGANNVRSASSEISQGNTDLSQRTEEQASSLEETASSMEEMTSTVKSNADNAKQARQLATAARDKASEGGDVVSKAVAAMGEINQSSKKISDIISVIDEIAFQTNLLALNAAVEAARAGEQGRGFAVVATEVRNLAQRSAQAAKEIKSLISDSVEKVDEGTKLVDASGKSLEEIVESVKKVSDIIAEIAAASEEQSTGLDEINKAVSQLDEVTQQNAALVEEAASASESLDDQARELLELMAFFKGSRTEMAPAPAASAPRTSGGAGGGAGQGAGAARPATRSSEAKQPRRPASARSGETAQSARDSKPAARAQSQTASGGGEEWEEF